MRVLLLAVVLEEGAAEIVALVCHRERSFSIGLRA